MTSRVSNATLLATRDTNVSPEYANRHGYHLLMDYEADDEMGTMWHKLTQFERAITSEKYDWIWWLVCSG